MQNLLELAKEQTELVNRENWKYYYQADEYKFNNVYLSNWYEREYNSWATFVAQPYQKIEQKLKTEKFDKNKDYNLEFLKKLRSENEYIRLFFSGGVDSYTIFKMAIDNDIFIDELVAIATGNNLKSKENLEIYKNAIPLAEKHKGTYGKFTCKQVTLDHHHSVYKDPMCLLKYPECGADFPMYRRMWNNHDFSNGVNIFSSDKPQLVYYNNRWYSVLLDSSLNGLYSADKNLLIFNFEAENIFSLIKDSINYRNYLLENTDLDKKMQFFKLTKNFSIIGREEILKDGYPKSFSSGPNIWNYKDHHALCETVEQQKLELLKDYYKAVDVLLSVYPDYNFESRNLSSMKFGWFIDIDNLEIYTQQELIPNGFEENE